MPYFHESGFAAIGSDLPQPDAPRDWLVWHFTHCANLPKIIESGHLYPSTKQDPVVNVANRDVKARRREIPVQPDEFYPQGKSVADHVPFYMAAKSPMLYAVAKGHQDYSGGCDSLVFLGLPISSIVDSGLVWCASDANAATDLVQFTRNVDQLGSFVDFDLLCEQIWKKTPDDPNRPSRRAAEVLILDQLPVDMITHVVARTGDTLDQARSALESVGGSRQYRVEKDFYYD
jgi:hypothetical protein